MFRNQTERKEPGLSFPGGGFSIFTDMDQRGDERSIFWVLNLENLYLGGGGVTGYSCCFLA